ncbi:MAG: SIMPL domain-containing protein [Clostridia bacterium]|nr:SIMPL domain-containing protein [Clostridia bacterium]
MKIKLLKGLGIMAMTIAILTAATFYNPATVSEAAEANAGDRMVTVSGEGKIVVTPDVAHIELGVQTKNEDATVAQQNNAKLMSAVVEAIKKAGIDEKDIQTTGYSLYQTYDYQPDGSKKDPYYVANNIVRVKIKDVDSVGKIIDLATVAGANTVNSIQFSIEDDSEFYQEALKLAMVSAKSKATAIMGTFEKTPGLPKAVVESSSSTPIIYGYGAEKTMAADMATPIESGEITITANVSVSYDY